MVEPVKKTIIKKDNTGQLRFIKKTDKLCDLNRFCELPSTIYDFCRSAVQNRIYSPFKACPCLCRLILIIKFIVRFTVNFYCNYQIDYVCK